MPPVKTLFTLGDYIPKGFFGNDSSDDDFEKEEVAQYYMVSWADEWEEVNVKPINTTQEVDQITLRSGRQLQLPEPARKEKEKEMTVKKLPTSENAKEQKGKEALSSSSNSKSVTRDKELTKTLRRISPSQSLFKFVKGLIKRRSVMMLSPISSESQHA